MMDKPKIYNRDSIRSISGEVVPGNEWHAFKKLHLRCLARLSGRFNILLSRESRRDD